MMKFELFVSLAVTLCVLDLAWTYPDGAPDQACSDMMPMHYINQSYTNPVHSPQAGKPYFSIHVDKQWGLTAGDMVMVTLKADEHHFEGFLIQAHDDDDNMLGEFVPIHPDTKRACWGQAMTHSEHKHYDEASFYWTVPAVGEYTCTHLVGTVVKGYSTYFMGVKSDQLCIDPVTGAAPDNNRPFAAGLLLLAATATLLAGRM